MATPGTLIAEVSDTAPEEPEWLRDVAGRPVTERDPTAPAAPPVDPKVLAARKAEREAQILKALNPEQARAVTTTEGPLLILAGAGSGKTRVLAHRIAYLVGVKDVPPWSFLALTFTNRTACALRDRTISLIGQPGPALQAAPIHSL